MFDFENLDVYKLAIIAKVLTNLVKSVEGLNQEK